MHEWGAARRLLQLIEAEARARQLTRISRVRLEIGAMNAAQCETLRLNFRAAAQGGVAQDAELDIHTRPVPALCPACLAEVLMSDHHQPCPHCRSASLTPLERDTLRLTELVAT